MIAGERASAVNDDGERSDFNFVNFKCGRILIRMERFYKLLSGTVPGSDRKTLAAQRLNPTR